MSKKENYLTAYIFQRNKTIAEYIVNATKKFIIEDEAYVIKDDCTYKKRDGDRIKLVAYYSEGNPNPYNLRKIEKNIGLNDRELDDLIAGDVYNILIECQNINKQRYMLGIACLVLMLSAVTFIFQFFF